MATPPTDERHNSPLFTLLLLGTSRSQEVALHDALPDGLDPEDPLSLLEWNAKQSFLRKGAGLLPHWKGDIPAPPEQDGNALPCPPRSALHLEAMLKGHHAEALPELLGLFSAYKRRLPRSVLPGLLDNALTQPKLWPLLHPLLDGHAHWLMRQHPQWRAWLDADFSSPASLASIPEKERPTAFGQWRKSHPHEARYALQTAWPDVQPSERAKLLPLLAVNLSMQDEPFLERCLDDKRKEVRLAAAGVLHALPDSAHIERLFSYAKAAMQPAHGSLHLEIPATLPAATQRDGILPTGSKIPGGLGLNWLAQMVACIPPERWLAQWQCSAEQAVSLFLSVRASTALQTALAQALTLHPQPELARALAKAWLKQAPLALWQQEAVKDFFIQIPSEDANVLLLQQLELEGPLLPPDTLPGWWLLNMPHRWTLALSKVVVMGFLQHLRERGSMAYQYYHYTAVLKTAAYKADVQLLDQLRQAWSYQHSHLGRWNADFEQLLQVLHFRKEMRQALSDGA